MKRIVSLLLAAALLLSLCACAKKENYRGNGRKLPAARSYSTAGLRENGKQVEAAYNWTENGCEITLHNLLMNGSDVQIIGSYDDSTRVLRLGFWQPGLRNQQEEVYVWRYHYTETGRIDWWEFIQNEDTVKGILTHEGAEVRLVIDEFNSYNWVATLDSKSNTGTLSLGGSQAPFTYSNDGHLWMTAKNAAASYDRDGDLLTLLDAEGNGISATTYGEAKQTAPWQQTAELLFYYMLPGAYLLCDGEVWFDEEAFVLIGLDTYLN